MPSTLALTIGLPLALCIIMLGLGLSLRVEDFTRGFTHPAPLLVGLLCQLVILPACCLALILAAKLPPHMAVGMMLLAASPAGTSGALFTHLARGDVALSMTFAATNTLLAMITLPLITNHSLALFVDGADMVALHRGQILQLAAIAILPAAIGVFIRSRYPVLAARLDRRVKLLAMIFLAVVIAGAVLSNLPLIAQWGPSIGAVVLAFNLFSLLLGYFVPRLLRLGKAQAIAIALTIGLHNAALVIAVTLSETMLNNSEMAIAPALYGLVAYFTAAAFVWIINRTSTRRLAQGQTA